MTIYTRLSLLAVEVAQDIKQLTTTTTNNGNRLFKPADDAIIIGNMLYMGGGAGVGWWVRRVTINGERVVKNASIALNDAASLPDAWANKESLNYE